MQMVFEEYLNYIKGVKHFSEKTCIAYRLDMQLFSGWLEENEFDFGAIKTRDVRIFAAELSDRHFAPASVNRILSCIRGFYRYAVRQGVCEVNPAAPLRNIKQPEKLPCFLFPREADDFCSFPKKAGILWQSRDAALFCSLYSTGCRVSEIAGLRITDFDSSYSSAIVYGKGKKERKVFFADFAQEALKAYLPERNALLQKRFGQQSACTDILFLNWMGKALTVGGIQYIIKRYCGLLPNFKKITPHAFRHSFASMFVSRGADIRVVQELLGHSSIAATQRYTHITAAQLQQLYHKAHPHG